MVKIDPSYDVVLTYSPGIHEITGHIFECFDYYLFLRDYFKVGILFLDSLKRSFLKKAFEDKYIYQYESIEKDIVSIDGESLRDDKIFSFGPKTVVLLADGNLISLKNNGIIFATKYQMSFACLAVDAIKTTMNKRMVYLQDYRIYSKNPHYISYDYVKKLPFEHYKKAKEVDPSLGLMYVTYNCRKITKDIVQKYHKLSGCTHTTLVVPYRVQEYEGIEGVTQVEAPLEGMFDRFGTYIYTPVERKFDCSPRLVTECFMQGKKVFLDLDYADAGLQTRYNDCKEGIERLHLKAGDKIIDIICQVRQKQ